MSPETIDREQAIQRRRNPWTARAHAATLGNAIPVSGGYKRYPPSVRPHCDMCGPFRHPDLRRMPDGEYRCRGCDNE